MKNKLTQVQKDQLDDLISETILPSLNEDLGIVKTDIANAAIDYLSSQLAKFKAVA